ncbi:tail fiber protein [Haliangium sp.]|uniref:tail fiber protein n=1 Tax=Haliangium sp. TaxID=2663208 RepID=UPI003D118D18
MSDQPTFDPNALDSHLWPIAAEYGDDPLMPLRDRVATQAFDDQRTRADVIGLTGVPAGSGFFGIAVEKGDLVLAPGRCYVNGLVCRNDDHLVLDLQPDSGDGVYQLVLQAWEHELRPVEDLLALGRPAVGQGFATRGRTRTLWRVRADKGGASAAGDPIRLGVRASREIAEDALYRIEVHGHAPARFKSSANNGNTATRLLRYGGESELDRVLVLATTVDDFPFGQSFRRGKWVEVVEHRSAVDRRSWLATIEEAEGNRLTVAWDDDGPEGRPDVSSYLVTVHQWDTVQDIAFGADVALPSNRGDSELELRFTEGTCSAGDYWLVPTLQGRNDILWPAGRGADGAGRAPDGPVYHTCSLGQVMAERTGWTRFVLTSLPEFESVTRLTKTAVRRAGDRVDGALEVGQGLRVTGGAIVPTAGDGEDAGILFPKDAFGGSGDRAWIRYYRRGDTGESTTFEVGTSNNAADHIALMPSKGNVGIGISEPRARLHVDGRIMDVAGEVMPRGAIVMWTGDEAPEGWALCDGSNGTPNLRNRFVICAGPKYNVNDTGGEEEVKLEIKHMPEHNHNNGSYNRLLKVDGKRTHAVTDNSSSEPNLHESGAIKSTGGDQAHNNMPPYYALAFIMKL